MFHRLLIVSILALPIATLLGADVMAVPFRQDAAQEAAATEEPKSQEPAAAENAEPAAKDETEKPADATTPPTPEAPATDAPAASSASAPAVGGAGTKTKIVDSNQQINEQNNRVSRTAGMIVGGSLLLLLVYFVTKKKSKPANP
jgi:predicted component of type VI protein secretion system